MQDGTDLVLKEIQAASPGFAYDFTFQNFPGGTHHLNVYGYYAGNPAHEIILQQYNYTLTRWDNVTGNSNDFPSRASDAQYDYDINVGADYVSSGQLKLRLNHADTGVGTHLLYLDYFVLLQQLGLIVPDMFLGLLRTQAMCTLDLGMLQDFLQVML